MVSFVEPLWMKVNNLSFLQDTVLFAYHFMNGNRQKIEGNGNAIHLDPSTSYTKNITFEIWGDQNIVTISKGARLENLTISIKGSSNRLIVGENCYIGGGYLSFEDDKGQITIGQDTSILGVHIVVSEPGSAVSLGKDCLLSYDIDIRTGDSHSIIDVTSRERLNYAQSVKIENHVWIGAHVQILKGVSIGPDCVIGTGAVVTNDVPGNSIAVGIPARVVRSGVTWLKEKIYTQDRSILKS